MVSPAPNQAAAPYTAALNTPGSRYVLALIAGPPKSPQTSSGYKICRTSHTICVPLELPVTIQCCDAQSFHDSNQNSPAFRDVELLPKASDSLVKSRCQGKGQADTQWPHKVLNRPEACRQQPCTGSTCSTVFQETGVLAARCLSVQTVVACNTATQGQCWRHEAIAAATTGEHCELFLHGTDG
jgi:hypothetical protein